jgi:hypothetical protein
MRTDLVLNKSRSHQAEARVLTAALILSRAWVSAGRSPATPVQTGV